MKRPTKNQTLTLVTIITAVLMALIPTQAHAGFCIAPDNGTGTVTLPPDCQYVSPDEVFEIIDGLPPGTTIELDPLFGNFINISETIGGSLGGHVQTYEGTMQWDAKGTGDLVGFNRHLTLQVTMKTESGPRVPGDPVQSFDAAVVDMQGQITGDPDFASLTLIGGNDNGLPSPGHTTLTRLGPPGSDFAVDSFFDITYRIDFVGAPGGQLEDLAGSTQATLRMENIPEPATLALLGVGGLLMLKRRKEVRMR